MKISVTDLLIGVGIILFSGCIIKFVPPIGYKLFYEDLVKETVIEMTLECDISEHLKKIEENPNKPVDKD